jgi:hypothetical protein
LVSCLRRKTNRDHSHHDHLYCGHLRKKHEELDPLHIFSEKPTFVALSISLPIIAAARITPVLVSLVAALSLASIAVVPLAIVVVVLPTLVVIP